MPVGTGIEVDGDHQEPSYPHTRGRGRLLLCPDRLTPTGRNSTGELPAAELIC